MLCRSTVDWWVLKAERPPVTPAAHCERAPTQTRRCLSSWDHNTTMELWFQITNLAWGLGQRSPCDAGPAGPALRQTETLGGGGLVNPPTLRRRQRQAQRPKTDWGGLGAQICFFNCWVWVWASAYYSYFCSTGFPASCPQRQILRINNVLWGQEVESNNTARQRRKI